MKRILPIILLTSALVLFSLQYCFADKITILYTGRTHANLYPCHCPKAPLGGVARRASKIKELRQEDFELLLLDSGDFFAGGAYDPEKSTEELDKERTRVNIRAMNMMGYDAALVGADELGFGKEFLKDVMDETSISFLSCDVDLDGIIPFIIKEVKGIRIGILAVMPQIEELKSEINIASPSERLKENVEKMRGQKVDIIILLSQLDESEIIRLLNEGLNVDIILSSFPSANKESLQQVNSKIIVRASWIGKHLGRIQFEYVGRKINELSVSVDEIPMSQDIKDNPEVLSILPECFTDKNCLKRGYIGSCQNPGTADSKCLFTEQARIPLMVIEPENCLTCDATKVADNLKGYLPGLKPEYLKSNSKKAQELIKKLDIIMLPAYILDKKSAEKDKGLNGLIEKEMLELKGDKYLANSSFAGVSYFLGRQYVKGKLDLFISLSDKNSKKILDIIQQLLTEMQNKIDFNLHFLALEKDGEFQAKGGLAMVEEYKRLLCIKKNYPDKWWDYMLCRAENIQTSWRQNCLVGENINYDLIKDCSQKEDAITLLRDNIGLTQELKIFYGPLILLHNQEIFGINEKTQVSELKRILESDIK